MKRKKWTSKTEVTDSVLTFREKRKWQIALRRYVLEQKGCDFYAPYFGLDIKNFRNWIEIQFDEDLNWGNFSANWQFDHIVPVAYFDFTIATDLKLCWNFINIRVEKQMPNRNSANRIDVLSAKAYFESLYNHTQYPICQEMVKKINQIEIAQFESALKLENFIREKNPYLQAIKSFSQYEYAKLNYGFTVDQISEERELLMRFYKPQ